MRLIHLAGYGGSYPGSFIPMLRAVMGAAARRAWECEAVFTPISRRELTGWVADMLAEREGPAVLHTHFTHFDVAAAMAGARRDDTAVIWHVHTPHLAGASAFARNYVKYAVFGRRTDQSWGAPVRSEMK